MHLLLLDDPATFAVLYTPSISPTPACDFYYSSSLHSQTSTHFSSKWQCLSFLRPFCQLKNTRNERLRTPLSRAAPPIRHEGFTSSLMPKSPYSQPCQDEQWPSKEPLSPIMINDTSNTSSSMDDTPSILSPPPSSNLTPFLDTPTSSSPLFWGPSQTGTPASSPTYGNQAMSAKSDVLSHSNRDMNACLQDAVSLHSDGPKGCRRSEFKDSVAQVIKQVTGEEVTEGDATRKLVTMSIRMLYLSSPLQPLSMTLWSLPTALRYLSPPHLLPPTDKVFLPPNCTSATQHFHNSTPAHISRTKEPRNSKNKERVARIDEQTTEEIAVIGEGEELTKASREPITMTVRTLYSSTVLLPSSMPSSTVLL